MHSVTNHPLGISDAFPRAEGKENVEKAKFRHPLNLEGTVSTKYLARGRDCPALYTLSLHAINSKDCEARMSCDKHP
jgi:hypothetical protein